ncbi:methyltransferase-like protein C27D7.08c [Seiridium cupressi]
MTDFDDVPASLRGTKRKQPGDEVKLTFSQRLAASRKIPKHAAPGSDATSDVADDRSSLKFFNSSDNEGLPEDTAYLHKDEHFRDLYASEINFEALANQDDEFRACLKKTGNLDFSDPLSVVQLTKSLLRVDYGLQIEVPGDRLCPPVPNRHNYILWIKELLDSSSSSYSETYEPRRKVTGVDIGTGASAIYPLLGCVQRPAWSFIATEIDDKSLAYAQKNIALNDLLSRVQVVKRSAEERLIPLEDEDAREVDFIMTNPPFYTSESELLELANKKAQPPNSVCTGAPNEMVYEGGELGFFRRILTESLVLRSRVQWYTTMLGKQSSLEIVIQALKENNIENYAITEFVQGSRTRRWAVGWSFVSRRPNNKACRGFEPAAGKKLLPHLTDMTVASKDVKRGGALQLENVFWTQLEDVTDGLDLVSWSLDEDRLRVVGFADQNVWSRAYRRSKTKQSRAMKISAKRDTPKSVSECPFGFSIAIRTVADPQAGKDNVVVIARWLQGTDYALFESFAGMLRNALLNVVS